MKDLQDLINTAKNLSDRLDQMAADEKRFCTDICLRLEQMSWEAIRMMDDLKSIQNYAA